MQRSGTVQSCEAARFLAPPSDLPAPFALASMADSSSVALNPPHAPHKNAIEAFTIALPAIKREILKSRHDWDKHEPKMWIRARDLSNEQLVDFDLERDLVTVRSGATSYGTIILGKIRIPAINDELGEGFIHVR